MGFVYRATQSPIEREVALKVLRVDLAHQEGIAERFTREARAASRIQHPNAITIFEFGEDDGIFYLAMELLYGETLRQRMRREPPLEAENALDIFEAMAGALAAAHRVGVVHRDLKPDNIFLAQFDGLGEVVKVLDFGLAKLLDRAADAEGLVTDVNLRLGTPRYMAPEQALGLQPIDARCDVYALGLLLFEMLAQRAPYTGEDGMEVLAQRLRREAPRLSAVAPGRGYSEHLDDLLANMLLRDREHRPADANEVVTRLRELRKAGLCLVRERDERTDQNPVVPVNEPPQYKPEPPQYKQEYKAEQPYKPSPTPLRGRPVSASGVPAPGPLLSPPGYKNMPSGPPASQSTPVVSGQRNSSGPSPGGLGMGLDDFDKPTVVITSGRSEIIPARNEMVPGGIEVPAGMSVGAQQVAYGPVLVPHKTPRRNELASEQSTTAGRTQKHAAALHLSPRFILVVLLIAAGAPLLALLIRWYQGRNLHVEPIRDDITAPSGPSIRPTATSMAGPKPVPRGDHLAPQAPLADAQKGAAEHPKLCRIRLVSTPAGARVERDGTDIGITPLTDSMPYGSTPLAYRISAAGYATHEATVTPDHRRTLTIALKPAQ
jgi:serine/threonine protein kinase